MSPRTGRPKVSNPKSYDVKVRYDEEMHEALLAYCEKHNITKVEAFRRGLNLLLGRK